MTLSMARSIWAIAPDELVEKVIVNQEEDPKAWLFALHEILDVEDFTRLVVTAWAVWGARRKAVYEDIFQSPFANNSFITKYLSELKQVSCRTQRPMTVPISRPSTWLPPPQGCANLNADAAISLRSRYDAIASVCRDQQGDFSVRRPWW